MNLSIGTQVYVSGMQRTHDGRPCPYGYVATVAGTHVPTGRLQVEMWQGRRVVREDETVEVR